MTEPIAKRKFFGQKNNRVIFIVVAVCLLALLGGVIMDAVLYTRGAIDKQEFTHRMLFILNTVGAMCIVFVAEILLRMRFPLFLEIAATLFAFAATGLATVYGFYELVYEWDSVLHTVSGTLFAITGLCVASLLFRDKLEGTRKAIAWVLFALVFSLAIGYLWEIFEYTLDSILPNSDLQPYDVSLLKDANGNFVTTVIDGKTYYYTDSMRGSGLLDTMRDMIVHLIGALALLVPALIIFLKKPSAIDAFAVTVYPRRNKVNKEKEREFRPEE
ncbi:MAG: hypothetical protein K2H43_07170 [Clostridia bacterium]|nr:hypothetical protein [Clostridia bacterium]